MSFLTVRDGALEYFRAGELAVPNAFSTRLGGVSTGALSSLNLGVHRGDRPGAVLENWRRLSKSVGFDWKRTVFTHQIHTDRVRVVGGADCGRGLLFPAGDCDGLITGTPGIALAVFSADCTLILLSDPITGAVGAVHAGWRGTALGIARRAVERMQAEPGCNPGDIRAAIGPCIDRCCFETRADVPRAMLAALGDDALPAIDDHGDGRYHVDLKELNSIWLRRAGVRQISVSCRCTACETERFWSHRRAGEARGVQAAVIVCPERKEQPQ